MKLFVGKLLLFIALFFVSDFVLGIIVGDLHLKTENINLQNANYGFLNRSSDDILFFGASEVSHTFISNRVAEKTGLSAYNLASDGCGIFYQLPLLETILEKHTPKAVLLSSNQLNEQSPDYLTRAYPYYNDNIHVKKVIDQFYPREHLKLLFQGYIYNSQIIRIFDDRNDNLKGYVPLPQVRSKTDITLIKELPQGRNYPMSKETIAYFTKFIERASSQGVVVYIYVTPMLEKINEDYLNTIVSLTENTGARLIDFSRDSSLLDRRELFNDRIHLNHEGAKLMTDRFIEILKKDGVY